MTKSSSKSSKSSSSEERGGNPRSRELNRKIANVMFVVTNGNYTGPNPMPKALEFRRMGGIVVSIGIGRNVRRDVIRSIGSRGLAFIIRDYADLHSYIDIIIDALVPNPCPLECSLDMATVLENSRFSHTPRILPFVITLQSSVNVRGSGTHVAMVRYASHEVLEWNFFKYMYLPLLRMRTKQLTDRFKSNEKNLAKVLKFTSEKLFACGCKNEGLKRISSSSDESHSRREKSHNITPHHTPRMANPQSRCDPSYPEVMLVVYDGSFTGRPPYKIAENFKRQGGVVVAVGTGSGNKHGVKRLASPGLGYFIDDPDKLRQTAFIVARNLGCL